MLFHRTSRGRSELPVPDLSLHEQIWTCHLPGNSHRFDESRGDLLAIRLLVPPDQGTRYVLDDPELRIWAAGYPSLTLQYFNIVNMDTPEKEQIAKLEYESPKGSVDAKLFAKPDGIAIGAHLVSRPGPDPQTLKEIIVSRGKVVDGDWQDYRYLRIPGPVGGIQPESDAVVQLFAFDDGQLVFRVGGRAIVCV